MRSFGAVLDGPRPHVVLEHIEGPRLSTLIRRYGVAIEQLLPLGLDLIRLLRYFEAEDVLHLDVKPRNIIMAGRPRLIDLSVAQREADVGAADVAGRHRGVHGAGAVRRRALRRAVARRATSSASARRCSRR